MIYKNRHHPFPRRVQSAASHILRQAAWLATVLISFAIPLQVESQTIDKDPSAYLNAQSGQEVDTALFLERARMMGMTEDELQQILDSKQTAVVEPESSDSMIVSEQRYPERAEIEALSVQKPDSASAAASDLLVSIGPWKDLSYFGYDIFRAGRELVNPVETGLVDPGYVIGSDDVLRLSLWGDVEFQYELPVDPSGNIFVPKAGQIFVAGSPLSDLHSRMQNYLSKFYSGLASDPPTVFMDVSPQMLHGNQIYIMGEVERPGAYTISSYATAFNAMYAIGGPRITGSLRDVRVLRDGKAVARVDLYNYLVKGLSTNDIRLRTNDIVFVPPRINTAGIKGEVNRSGIYELKDDETIEDLIAFAGELLPTAYAYRAQVEGILPRDQRTPNGDNRRIEDVDLTGDGAARRIADGDLVIIFPIVDRLTNYVELSGDGVYRPGRYELDDIATFSELISKADGITPWACRDRAEIVRTRDDLSTEFIEIDLESALSGKAETDPALKPMDQIRVYSKQEMLDTASVTLSGHVKQPGSYLLPENLTLYSLVFNYSGLQDSLWRARTFMDRGDILRLSEDGLTKQIISFDPQALWGCQFGADMALQASDEVVIYSAEITEMFEHFVFIDGFVIKPGRYSWKQNMTLADLLRECAGFAEGAMITEAEVARIPEHGLPGDSLAYILHVPIMHEGLNLEHINGSLTDIFRGQTQASQFALKPHDHIYIRSNPEWEIPLNIEIQGEVVYPGKYTLKMRNETLCEMVERAGGITSEAYTAGGQIRRNGQRLFLDFEHALSSGDRRENIALRPGDIITIPKRPNMVMITGEVMNPGFYNYLRGASPTDYLAMAGGRTENGERILVLQPSGRTFEPGFLGTHKPLDGAIIQVYPKPLKKKGTGIDWSGIIKDTFAIAASAATVVVVVDRLNQ